MRNTTARRWLAGLGVVGALVAVAGPASAAAPDVSIGIDFPDTIVVVDHSGRTQSPNLTASTRVELQEVTVTFDFSDLTGKVVVTKPAGTEYCTSPGATLVCEAPWPIETGPGGSRGLFEIVLTADSGAREGDEGVLRVSLRAEGFDAVSDEARIRVGGGVDLVGGPETEASASPGASFSAETTVTNAGATTARGVAVVFDNDRALSATRRFSNCRYDEDVIRGCVFAETLERGTTYRMSLPYTLRPDTFAPSSLYNSVTWMTPAEFETFPLGRTARGTAGRLTLTRVRDANATMAQTDIDPENNGSGFRVKVTGDNRADLAAIGDTVTGVAGDVLTAAVGVVNNGPAAIDMSRGGGQFTNMWITVPAGTTAVTVPERCSPRESDGNGDWEQAGKPGARAYHCYSKSRIGAGERQTFEFELRIDEVAADATGTIEINIDCTCGGLTSDLDGSNDLAKILVNPSADGGGGGLPVTGASTGIVAGAGVLLLAAGAFGFALARRRRTSFVA